MYTLLSIVAILKLNICDHTVICTCICAGDSQPVGSGGVPEARAAMFTIVSLLWLAVGTV